MYLAGYCVANDFLFLRNRIPHYPHFHYRTIELEDLIFGITGSFHVNDDVIEQALGVRRRQDEKPHDGMGDVRFQARAVRAAMIKVRDRRLNEAVKPAK